MAYYLLPTIAFYGFPAGHPHCIAPKFLIPSPATTYYAIIEGYQVGGHLSPHDTNDMIPHHISIDTLKPMIIPFMFHLVSGGAGGPWPVMYPAPLLVNSLDYSCHYRLKMFVCPPFWVRGFVIG